MSLEDLPGINRILDGIVPGLSQGLTFQKFTGNDPNLGDFTPGDYIIYVSGSLHDFAQSATPGIFSIFDPVPGRTLISINHSYNLIPNFSLPFSFSVMMHVSNNVSGFSLRLKITYDINNISNFTTNFDNLTWWKAKVM